MKNCYEYFVLLGAKTGAAEQEAFLEKFEKVMSSNDVERVGRDDWGKRALAYPIAKQKDARYIVYHLKAPPAVVKELERNCRLDERVLRHLAIRVAKLKPGVAPTEADPRRRERRGERWGGGRSFDRPRGPRPPRDDAGAASGGKREAGNKGD